VKSLPSTGVYVLEIASGRRKRLKIGQLGDLGLAPGIYLYVGSARRHLPQRVARHSRPDKPLHWHVDYLTAHAQLSRVAVWDCAEVGECELAQAVRSLPGARVVLRGFGASDCGCEAHLIRLDGEREWVRSLSDRLGRPVADVQWGDGQSRVGKGEDNGDQHAR
jgi:Uri superfamily endonuclease